jgi:FPC/CPF motif-containing protein YcgG
LKHSSDFEDNAILFLNAFNDENRTWIASAAALEARVPGEEVQRNTYVHFQRHIMAVTMGDGSKAGFRYTSLGSASLTEENGGEGCAPAHTLSVRIAKEDTSNVHVRLTFDNENLRKLRDQRRAFEILPGWQHGVVDDTLLNVVQSHAKEASEINDPPPGQLGKTANRKAAAMAAAKAVSKVAPQGRKARATKEAEVAAIRVGMDKADQERRASFAAAFAQAEERTCAPGAEHGGASINSSRDARHESASVASARQTDDHADDVASDDEDDPDEDKEGDGSESDTSGSEYIPIPAEKADARKRTDRSARSSTGTAGAQCKSAEPRKKLAGASASPAALAPACHASTPAPKAFARAFDAFVDAMRPKLSVKYPEATNKYLRSVLSRHWKDLTAAQKAPWQKQVASKKSMQQGGGNATSACNTAEEGAVLPVCNAPSTMLHSHISLVSQVLLKEARKAWAPISPWAMGTTRRIELLMLMVLTLMVTNVLMLMPLTLYSAVSKSPDLKLRRIRVQPMTTSLGTAP